MITSTNNPALCTLCPALCGLELTWQGPDLPRAEFPQQAGTGLCPRGSALGELLASPARIRWPQKRDDVSRASRPREADENCAGKMPATPSWRELSQAEALAAAAGAMAGGAVVLFDGNVSIEELAQLARIGSAWPKIALCPVVLPEDEQALLGVEASGANYLADRELAQCDGFLIVGDAFAANPRLARHVFDAVRAGKRVPVVCIDSGGGVTGNFATQMIACPAGGELAALQDPKTAAALGSTQRLGVVLAPQAMRGAIWQRVAFLGGKLALAHGGGVAVATGGANALAAVRARRHYGWMSLASALDPSDSRPRICLGADVLGMLGWSGPGMALAAAPLPNQTTALAQIVLPLALPCEVGGSYLQAGREAVMVGAMMNPPAGSPTVSGLLAMLAQAAGVSAAGSAAASSLLERVRVAEPADAPPAGSTGVSPVQHQSCECGNSQAGRLCYPQLVLTPLAMHQADGSLSGHASWQRQAMPLSQVLMSAADAAQLGLEPMDVVTVKTGSGSAEARVRVVANLAAGTLAITPGDPQVRRLSPYAIDARRDALVSNPVLVEVVKTD